MVEPKTHARPAPTDAVKQRADRRRDRLAKVAEQTKVPRVRVVPATDALRSVLRHPSGNIGFRPEGSIEWPLDSFTKKRIREGAVSIEQQQAQSQPQSRPQARPAPKPDEPQQEQPKKPAAAEAAG